MGFEIVAPAAYVQPVRLSVPPEAAPSIRACSDDPHDVAGGVVGLGDATGLGVGVGDG
jgi:hypothetical protein